MKILAQKKRLILAIAFLFIVLGVVGIYTINYLGTYSPAKKEALLSLISNHTVSVSEGSLITFEPYSFTEGLIFYPGGKVDPKAYAPLCRYIAMEGKLCVIVTMPFNLAVLNINGADEVIKKYPDVHEWIIAGHSLGGSMAARYLESHSNNSDIKGLALLAAYSDVDISDLKISAKVFTGTKDGFLSKDNFENSKTNLPANTEFVVIDGGNHAQFGLYEQDNPIDVATITWQEQFDIYSKGINPMFD